MAWNKVFTLGVLVLLASISAAHAGTIAPPAGATAIFSDDFEGYGNNAAFLSVWNGVADSATSLAIGQGKRGGNGASTSGGQVAQKNIPALSLSDATPITLEFDYWDYTTGNADRLSVGLRSPNALFEFGEYNLMDPDPTITGSTAYSGYGFRTTYVGGPTELGTWVAVVQPQCAKITSTDPAIGYHHFKMVIGSTYVTAQVQLSNGQIRSTTVALTKGSGKTLDNVRIGGPSGVSSTGTGIFDNLQIYTTPEPASLGLLTLGGLLLRRRRGPGICSFCR